MIDNSFNPRKAILPHDGTFTDVLAQTLQFHFEDSRLVDRAVDQARGEGHVVICRHIALAPFETISEAG